jgi:DNA-binding HxlR family transcriptional regulator
LLPTDIQVTTSHDLHAEGCATASSLLSRVGDKWTLLVIFHLTNGPRRFNELRRTVGGISQRILTLTLRGLERDGLVTRTVYPTVPPRVEYELTTLGHSLRVPVEALGSWATEHHATVLRSREEFDSRGRVAHAPLSMSVSLER